MRSSSSPRSEMTSYCLHVRFLFSVIAHRSGEVTATQNEMQAIDAFNQQIESAGQRLMAAGVAAPEHAWTFDNRDGAGNVQRGATIDSDRFMAGFWVIDAESETVAHQLASEASKACNRIIEVRPLLS